MMPLLMTDWLIIILATGYATYAVTDNEGPLHIFRHIRNRIEGGVDALLDKGWHRLAGFVESFQDLMDCYVCLSFWMALGVLYVATQEWLLINALAVAGVYVGIRKLFTLITGIVEMP